MVFEQIEKGGMGKEEKEVESLIFLRSLEKVKGKEKNEVSDDMLTFSKVGQGMGWRKETEAWPALIQTHSLWLCQEPIVSLYYNFV